MIDLKMSQDQEFTHFLAAISQDCVTTLARAAEQKKVLTNIVIEEIPVSDKLAKMRQAILKYNAFVQQEKEGNPVKLSPPKQDEDALLKMTLIADTLEGFNNNMNPYITCFDSIANVLRDAKMSPEWKIDAIGSLLL